MFICLYVYLFVFVCLQMKMEIKMTIELELEMEMEMQMEFGIGVEMEKEFGWRGREGERKSERCLEAVVGHDGPWNSTGLYPAALPTALHRALGGLAHRHQHTHFSICFAIA